MEPVLKDHKQILLDELSKRMSENPRYSLRAFARDLKLSPQTLSNVLNGKRGLSGKTALHLAERIGFSAIEKEYFCNVVLSQFSRSEIDKRVAQAKLVSLAESNQKTSSLSIDSFRVISDWYHFGLIELLKIPASKSLDASALAKRLGIQATEVKVALERLCRLELISKTKQGWRINQETVLTTDGVPSEALKKFHKQVLDKASSAIILQSVEERYLSASFMPISLQDLPKAKKMIQKFRDRFTQEISKEEDANQVYSLSIQFFNLTHSGENS